MLPLSEIFAGIGLIFIGVRTLAANLRQIAGPRLRRMMSAAIRSAPRASLIGLLGGLATQSANGTAFIAVSMVSAGIIPVAPALPIVVWGAVGAMLGLCLLFLGIHFVKAAAPDLAADRTARDLLLLAQHWYPLGLVMGAAFGFLVQNGTTVAMIAANFAARTWLACACRKETSFVCSNRNQRKLRRRGKPVAVMPWVGSRAMGGQ
jgi:phosphate:Na+ symporter